ncbi:MAG: hypothetical protein IKQ15_00705 [Kiritimatiellae bacterium]|nr:hypothetical protein [Kiritimatiellia bacterium]
MPIDINDAFINAQFKTFVDFARGKDAGTKVRALIGNDGPEHTVGAKSANATASPTSKPWAGPNSSKKPSPWPATSTPGTSTPTSTTPSRAKARRRTKPGASSATNWANATTRSGPSARGSAPTPPP